MRTVAGGWQPDLHTMPNVELRHSQAVRDLVNDCMRYKQKEGPTFPQLLRRVQANCHLHNQQLRDVPSTSPLWTFTSLAQSDAVDRFSMDSDLSTTVPAYETYKNLPIRTTVRTPPAAALNRDDDGDNIGGITGTDVDA